MFMKNDNVEYHNNASKRAPSNCKNVQDAVREPLRVMTLGYGDHGHDICEMQCINPHHFPVDYLNGRLDSIPKPDNGRKTWQPVVLKVPQTHKAFQTSDLFQTTSYFFFHHKSTCLPVVIWD